MFLMKGATTNKLGFVSLDCGGNGVMASDGVLTKIGKLGFVDLEETISILKILGVKIMFKYLEIRKSK